MHDCCEQSVNNSRDVHVN
ncbi:hypothetical protein PHET_11170 [Paragonimus heterotremus]|uniref:Uncharacterized protein n=1 Tax=Paragonimus heterotremus TaxID=100268 RepID=A0A8J4WDX1_9TREM|nr:hypothetical protein PHET_11170 [Paragonimus heterotremus]